ncbi:MAG: T9SS type A sorting domain-containing protein [Sphingobacteriales bacterium JAD_PAG50586_3]|nr:MAG: T9SS type A sorting domain-containing protein [Sphingobacteriales bacterium JAD_PAG50586_3]
MKHLYIFTLLLISTFCLRAQSIINTSAGTGVAGYTGDGAAATTAQIDYPIGLSADNNGNYYFGDVFNHVVRKVSATGIITTVAGTGIDGSSGDGGQATAANLSWPVDVAVDDAHNLLYICDYMGQHIRKVDLATGIITNVAGTGNNGFSGDGGLAINATMAMPTEINLDTQGNVYFTDKANDRIRKIDVSTGFISTIAGTGIANNSGDGGPALSAEINHPYGIAIDGNNNIYFSAYSNHSVRRIDGITGIVTTVAGIGTAGFSGDGGPGNAAALNFPEGICVDSVGNVYIAELYNYRIRKVDMANNIISTIAGVGSSVSSGDGGDPLLAGMFCTAVDVRKGKVYIADLNHRIRVITNGNPPPPPISLVALSQTDSICSDNNNGTVTVQGSGGLAPYQYKIGNGAYQNNGTFTGLSAGTYTITVKDANGTTTSIQVTISPIPLPVASFTYSQIDNYHVNFTSTSTNATSYQWSFSTGANSTLQNPTGIDFIVEGTYSATLIVTNNCGIDSITLPVIVEKLSGTNENDALSLFGLYPNPANGSTTIKLEATKPIKGAFNIYTVDGQLVYSENIAFNTAYAKTIDLSSVASGIYIVNLLGENINLNKKLIVQK